ncbi:GmrSD restriction endonuclease domain-containing protein [Mycobacterium seoulense]|uniref:GmrSD restriction endonuclease domain-containing protein n=1 Tax=Mycobacterium seoulense TaxID=386911 RepID=UPI003CF735EF
MLIGAPFFSLCSHSTHTSTSAYHAPTTSWTAPLAASPLPHAPLLPFPSTPPPQPDATDASGASAKLATLSIKGRAPKTGYERSLFGQAWTDDVTVSYGHNGCDTRNDILRRDLVTIELKPDSNGCTVLSGVLHDPYTGSTVEFNRGQGTSTQVQIDHVVALSDAWQKGAQQWDSAKRRNFANDPINLQATSGSTNEQKGDGDAATWLPPNKSYRCSYVSRIVDVKATYGLWVTQAEHDAIAQILANCEAPAAAPGPPPVAPVAPETTSQYVPPPPAPLPSSGSPVYYPNCKAARAAGAAPIYAGQPGYRPGLDRDGDGVACE